MIFKNLLLVTHSLLLPAWLTPAQANMTISQSDSEASASPAEKNIHLHIVLQRGNDSHNFSDP